MHAQVAQRRIDHGGFASLEKDNVAHFEVQGGGNAFAFFLGKELGDRRLPFVSLDFDPGQTLRTVNFDKFGKGVNFLAGHGFTARNLHALHQGRGGKQLEAGTANNVRKVHKLKAKPRVGLVHAITGHGFVPLHAGERQRKLLAHHILEHAGHKALGNGHNLFFVGKAHFQVNLGKLRLTVGAQIFIAKTAHNLKIPVHASHHEQLLEQLGRLGQRIKLAVVQTAGHQKVACAFGRGLGEHRRFHFCEVVFVQIAARRERNLVAQAQVGLHARTAQVKITPGKAQVFARVAAVFNGKGRRFGSVQQLPFIGHHFDLAGHHVGIHHAIGAGPHLALDGQHILRAENVGVFMRGRRDIGAENYLGEAFAVAQVHKNQAAVIAPVLHPSHQANIFAVIFDGQPAARMAAPPVSKLGDVFLVFALHVLLRVLRLHLFSHCWFPVCKNWSAPVCGTEHCSPLSRFFTTTVPWAASSGPMIKQCPAPDLPAWRIRLLKPPSLKFISPERPAARNCWAKSQPCFLLCASMPTR